MMGNDQRKFTDNDKARDLSHHSANANDANKYQKSFPTPKNANATPLGYHTRRKQMQQHTSLLKDSSQQEKASTSALILSNGSEGGS